MSGTCAHPPPHFLLGWRLKELVQQHSGTCAAGTAGRVDTWRSITP